MTSQSTINCIITGAGGFVGQALASALLEDPLVSKLTLTDVVEPSSPNRKGQSKVEVRCVKADLTSLETCQTLFTPDLNLIYILHGIMSGQAEANFELGLKVNLDSTRQILDLLRRTNPGVKVIYPSSTAVYGPPATPTTKITEGDTPVPGTSYGAQKHICETLLDDYSRRGFLDGRSLRLPTVTVRPGKPTGAASSFASGIFREPLNGEKAILPVSKDLEVWICSPRTVVKNLILARDIPKEKFPNTRIVNLPGITVTVNEMLEALKAVGGDEALKRVEEQRDEATEKIVLSWPTRFDVSRAKQLGFADDGPLERTLQEYLEDYGAKKQ
ncbi:hypothetical protein JMJ35_001141 [Cladonia borealis]|uniref:NAD-dependent epimerase/dehydratase domain-containing protein n=1 Tax=Cladonia borealis TaxID=184061 RepID=A0AA39V4Z6_9LECA|nr:hypothetical protein JMJ35_001141 [Cladonia borealis]